MATEIYRFLDLPLELTWQLVAEIPVLSNGHCTIVFISDFCTLEDELQEACLELSK